MGDGQETSGREREALLREAVAIAEELLASREERGEDQKGRGFAIIVLRSPAEAAAVSLDKAERESRSASSTFIRMVADYLETCYMDEHIGLESTANCFCINPSYMGQLMKREFGRTFLQYLSDIRIKQAKHRLKMTHKTIREIAAEVGYSNRSTFIRVFKSVVGITPSDYRVRVLRAELAMEAASGKI